MTLQPQPTRQKVRQFHRFWQRAATDRPLLGLRLHSYYPLQTFQGGPRSGEVHPEQLHAEDYLADFERLQRQYDRSFGDEIHAASAYYGVPWLEAILGCEVHIQGESMWAEPALLDWGQLGDISFSADNPWYLKLLELTEETAQYFGNRLPTGPPLLRGPADIAAALRGNAQFCLDLIDEPEMMRTLLEVCAETYIQVTKGILANCPRWQAGYVEPIRHVWAPGPTVETQVDVSSLISPTHYRENLRPSDARVLQSFAYIYLHLHASSLHILDDVLAIDPLAAIELSLDVGGPGPTVYLDEFRKILNHKPLILQGVFAVEELVELWHALPHEGLYILTVVEDVEQGNELLASTYAAVAGY
jgi:hypothetical protein